MNKKCILFAIVALAFLTKATAQGFASITMGSSIDGKIVKDGQTYKSGFSPEVGICLGVFAGEGGSGLGVLFEWNLRFINVKEINFFEKSYKSTSDIYLGPALFLGDMEVGGIVISGMIGYSLSDFWGMGEEETNTGSLSFKVSADIVLGSITIGGFYRPETQLIKQKSWALQYGEYGYVDGFVYQPTWGVRLGIAIGYD